MDDDELRDEELQGDEPNNDTHVEDSREPASREDDESLVEKVKGVFTEDDEEE